MVDTGTILTSPFFTEAILPFLLVFTLVFAILERTKILGENRRQIDAIIAFVVGLIFISFIQAVDIAVNLIGLMALIAVIILVFMVLFGFVYSGEEFKMPKGLKIAFGILIGLALVIALLVMSGYWDLIFKLFKGPEGNTLATNIVFVIIAVVAILVVVGRKEKKG